MHMYILKPASEELVKRFQAVVSFYMAHQVLLLSECSTGLAFLKIQVIDIASK